MSSRRKHKKQTPSFHSDESRLDYLAVLPGLLLCAMTVLMLLMDCLIPGMDQEQYTDFPSMFRMVHAIILCAGILLWVLLLRVHGIRWLHPRTLVNKDDPYILFFILFAAWILLSTAVNGLDDKAIHGVAFRNIGVFHLLSFLLIYMFAASQVRRDSLRRCLMWCFLGTADLLALAALADRFIFDIPAFAQKKELSTIFFNGNHFGYFLTMAVLAGVGLFVFRAGRRLDVFGLLSGILNFAVLLLNHSLGCLLAVFGTAVLLLILALAADRRAAQRLGILLGCLAGALLLGLLLLSPLRSEFTGLISDLQQITGEDDASSAGHNRWMLWSLTIDLIRQQPLFGYGCERISDTLMDLVGRANPHSEPLTYAAFYGIPAALFYLLGLAGIFVCWVRRKVWTDPITIAAALAAFGYFISSLFGVPMFYTAPFFFIFLGISLARTEPAA